eukprot:m.14121 g.14121  ORF g.14121 m.14121 type:complete len:563 (-) comp4750_c0_seq1:281-1969(-)
MEVRGVAEPNEGADAVGPAPVTTRLPARPTKRRKRKATGWDAGDSAKRREAKKRAAARAAARPHDAVAPRPPPRPRKPRPVESYAGLREARTTRLALSEREPEHSESTLRERLESAVKRVYLAKYAREATAGARGCVQEISTTTESGSRDGSPCSFHTETDISVASDPATVTAPSSFPGDQNLGRTAVAPTEALGGTFVNEGLSTMHGDGLERVSHMPQSDTCPNGHEGWAETAIASCSMAAIGGIRTSQYLDSPVAAVDHPDLDWGNAEPLVTTVLADNSSASIAADAATLTPEPFLSRDTLWTPPLSQTTRAPTTFVPINAPPHSTIAVSREPLLPPQLDLTTASPSAWLMAPADSDEQQCEPNALVAARAVTAGETLFRERLPYLATARDVDVYEQRAATQWSQPVLELPGGAGAALVRLEVGGTPHSTDNVDDPRSTIYMMNQARGRAASVCSPFKFTVNSAGAFVEVEACAARDLVKGAELTWDYNPMKRFAWEPTCPARQTLAPPGPRPKRRRLPATGWGGADARRRQKAREAARRRGGAIHPAPKPSKVPSYEIE